MQEWWKHILRGGESLLACMGLGANVGIEWSTSLILQVGKLRLQWGEGSGQGHTANQTSLFPGRGPLRPILLKNKNLPLRSHF